MYRLFVPLLPAAFLLLMVAVPMWAILDYQDAAPLWAEMLADDYYRQRLLWTVFQAALTVLMTALAALPAAWVLTRLQFRGRETVLRLLMLPFVMPTLVAGMGVLALFGERGMLWRGWTETPYLLLYGNVFFNLPVMVRAACQGFWQVPANRLHALQTLGANAWQRFWQVEWPVLRPWLAGGGCLVFLYCFSGFGLALLLGGQDYATAEVEIYRLIAYELDMARAAVLVWLVLAVTAAAGLAHTWFTRRSDAAQIQPLPPRPPQTQPEKMLLAATLLLLFVCCALPLLAVAAKAAVALSAWRVFTDTETLSALWNTVRFSSMAVLLAAVLGLLHAAAARLSKIMRALTFLPFMVSPVCLAFGILLCYPQQAATLLMLVALYALLAYPFVTKDILAAWDALPPHYAAAARVFGANRIKTFWHVTLPLLLPSMRRGLTFAAATCVGEFAASLFLSRPEWTTLTTLIYRYFGRPGVQNHHSAMLLTLLLMLLAAAAFALLDKNGKKAA